MKKLLLFICCLFSLNAFAAEKEWVRVGDYFLPSYEGDKYGDANICTFSVEQEKLRLRPYMQDMYWSGKIELYTPAGYADGKTCIVVKGERNLTFRPLCKVGSWDSERPDGCYEFKEPPVNSCPAAGTVFVELHEEDIISTGSKGLICVDGCQLKVPGSIVCVEVDGKMGCAGGGSGNVTYTGLECNGSESDTGGGGEDGGEDGSGSGGDGDGNGKEEGANCVIVNGIEFCKEGSGAKCVYINGAEVCPDGEGKESSWGGDCKAGFTGEGDALAVAISKAEYERNCALLETPEESDEYAEYQQAREEEASGKTIGEKLSEGHPIINIKDYLDNSNALGTSRCWGGKTLSVLGGTVVLPLSELCEPFKWLGILLEAVSYIWAIRILVRG